MKKITLSLGILLLLTVFCWYSVYQVSEICRQASSYLSAAETRCLLGDYSGAENAVYQSRAVWESHQLLLGTALRHTESDQVDLAYPVLLSACSQQEKEEFLRNARQLRKNLQHLWNMEYPYLYNIL